MYLSHAVRTLRDDPVPGETVTLLLTLAEDHPDGVETTIEGTVRAAGGTVEDFLQFDTIAVTVPHEAIQDVCELDGIASIETDNTIGITHGDAGEDVDIT